jgi:hypothetical protein
MGEGLEKTVYDINLEDIFPIDIRFEDDDEISEEKILHFCQKN